MSQPFTNVQIHLKSMKIIMLLAYALRKPRKSQAELVTSFLLSSHGFQTISALVSCLANEVEI